MRELGGKVVTDIGKGGIGTNRNQDHVMSEIIGVSLLKLQSVISQKTVC
jgi:hypothetical protein